MEILFIWILDYKNIKKQGFNFSSEFIFEVNVEENNIYNLKISKNESYIPNFFEKDNILNVTAIVGQNGSGKSNVLEFIKTSFPKGYLGFENESIIVYRRGDIIIVLLPDETYYKVNNTSEMKLKFFYSNDDSRLSEGMKYSNAEYVYYSNIFDFRNEDIDMQGFHNISTIGLLKSDSRSYEEINLGFRPKNDFDTYKANEIKRNIQFLLSNRTDLLEIIPLPEFLSVRITDSNFLNIFGNKSKAKIYSQFAEKIVPIFDEKVKEIEKKIGLIFSVTCE